MFSRATIIETIQAFRFKTHSSIDMFEMRFELEDALPEATGLETRTANITRHLVSNPDATGPGGSNLTFEVLEYLLQTRLPPEGGWYDEDYIEEMFPRLVRPLRLDGYVIDGGALRSMLPEVVDLAARESELELIL